MRSMAAASALVIALLAGVSGCGGSSGDGASSTRATPQHAEGPKRKPRVPASLGRVESGAEDTIDFAHAGDRARVVATARVLLRAAKGPATADLREAGVPDYRVAELRSRARLLESLAPRADFARVSLAANRISALMPEFYARYRDPVPPDVLKLDYLDREAQLRSLAGDQASVPGVVTELSSTWSGLRARVIAAGGRRVAARYARHVAAMRRLARGPRGALQREAGTGLELVDELEHQFRKG
jgi:hypothetical protein